MEQHIEETPEMAKMRKAKAALKGAQSNIAEICDANDKMSRTMRLQADALDRIIKAIGDGVGVRQYSPKSNSYEFVEVAKLLFDVAKNLREEAV